MTGRSRARRSVRRLVPAALLLSLAATACGGDDDSDDAPAANAPEVTGTVAAGEPTTDLGGKKYSYMSAGSAGQFNTKLQESIIDAFNEANNAKVRVSPGDCGITQLAGEVAADNVSSIVWQFCTIGDFRLAEQEGLLVELDPERVPFELLAEGSYDEYGFSAFQFAMGLMYRTDVFPEDGPQPTTVLDIFDTDTFPGQRCIASYPQYQGAIEAAMLQAGEPAYPIDLEVATAELETIRDVTTYVSNYAEGFQDLLSGDCVMGVFPNGSAYSIAQENPDVPLAYTLGDAVVIASPVAIPVNTPDLDAAYELLNWFVTDTASQEAFVEATSYLPAVLAEPVDVPEGAAQYALTGDNLDSLVQQDDAFWAENIDQILSDWNAWLAG